MVTEIFFSHSFRDNRLLIEQITSYFEGTEFKPFFSRREDDGVTDIEKIENAIDRSPALFLLLDHHILEKRHTRDWVSYEIGYAKGKGKRIFAFCINLVGEDILHFLDSVTKPIPIKLRYTEKKLDEVRTDYYFDAEGFENLNKKLHKCVYRAIELQEPPEVRRDVSPPIYGISQVHPTGQTREFPDVGFTIQNPNDFPIKAKIKITKFLDGENFGVVSGHYSGEVESNLNPSGGFNGHFILPPEIADSKRMITLKLEVIYVDPQGMEHDELLPVGYVYVREQGYWYYEPSPP